MEYLPQTLSKAEHARELTEKNKLSIVMQLLSALNYLSRRDPPAVHRDIKPSSFKLIELESPHPDIMRTSTACSRSIPIPHKVVMATSAASRPTAMGISAGRTTSVVASTLCHAPLR